MWFIVMKYLTDDGFVHHGAEEVRQAVMLWCI